MWTCGFSDGGGVFSTAEPWVSFPAPNQIQPVLMMLGQKTQNQL